MADQNIQTVISTTVDTSQAQTGIVNLRKEFQGAFLDVQNTTKGTQEWFTALQHAADVRSEMTHLRQEIKLLDPREQFKAVATSIKGLTGGFQAAAGAAVLFGSKNKELEETLRQVLGAAQLFAGIQEFINGLRHSGELITVLNLKLQQNALANKAAAESSAVAAVGLEGETVAAEEATVATGGFNTILAASAIGAILLLIPLLAKGMSDVSTTTEDASKAQKLLNDAHEKGITNLSDDYTHVELLIQEYKNQNTTLEEKKKIQDELQNDYPNYFGNLDDEHDKVKALDTDYKKWSQSIILKAEADADAQIIQEKTQELLKAKLDPTSTLTIWQTIRAGVAGIFGGTQGSVESGLKSVAGNMKSLIGDTQKDIDTLTKDFIAKQQQIDANGGDPGKVTKTKSPREKAVKDENANILKAFAEFYAKLREEQLKANETTAADIAKYEDTVEKKGLEGREKELKEDDDTFQKAKFQVMLNGGDLEALETAHRTRMSQINKKWDEQDANDAAANSANQVKLDSKRASDIINDDTKSYKERKALLDKVRMIFTAPIMRPDFLIFRDEPTYYYGYFDKDTIFNVAQKYFRTGKIGNLDINHSGELIKGAYLFESFIIDSSRGNLTPSMYGKELPDGTWFGSFQVTDPSLWQQIESGAINGISIEGFFNIQPVQLSKAKSNIEKVYDEVNDILNSLA